MLIRVREDVLLEKLGNMLKQQLRLPKEERDHELVAIIKSTMGLLRQQRKNNGRNKK
jgi:hypothetical protein